MTRNKDYIKVTNLHVFAHHGVFEEEKKNGQDFYLNAKVYLDMRKCGMSDALSDTVNYDEICTFLYDVFSEKIFDTIEAAAEYTVQELMANFSAILAMELEVRKPHAPFTHAPEDISVNIYREWQKVYLSFGSNMENPIGHIEEAIGMLQRPYAIRNVKRSSLYVTKPYGPVEQDDFINGCLEMETYMDPEELVTYIHEIEDYFERDRSIRWGPRPIDMDIIFWEDEIYNSNTLTIPHADMENRMFVLEPLSELCSGRRHPVWGKTVAQMKAELLEKGNDEIIQKVEE